MTWARARRVAVLWLAVALTVLSLVPVSQITFGTDVLQLMPREAGVVDAFETYLERFGSLDQLYVYVEAPEEGAIADYADYVDALAARLRALPEVTRVDSGLLDPGRDWGYLGDRQLLLLDEAAFAEAVSRLDGPRIREQVRRTKELLALPSEEVKALAQRDPLGWFELMGERLQGASGVLRIDPGRTDGYVTPDGRARMLVVHPDKPPFDTDFARTLLARVSEAEVETRSEFSALWADEDLPAPRTDVAGGHRTAVETETLMRGESISNTVWSLVGVLTLLYLAFRNWWLVLFGAAPVLLGTLVTLALYQVIGVELSAAATGASAMLFGLGDDGLVLLFVAYRARLARGATPLEAVGELGGTGVSVLLGALTTSATFLGLWFMSFPSLQQLGGVIGIGMLLTVLFTLTVLVAGLPGREWVARSRDLSLPGLARWVARHRRAIVIVALVGSVPLAWGLTRVRVDPRIERLRPTGPGLALETRIIERFGLAQDVYLVMSRGAELEPLLTRHEALTDSGAGIDGLALVGPELVLPSRRAQAARREALAQLPAHTASVADAVDAAAADEGFVEGTFAPFRSRLPQLLDARQTITLEGLQSHGLGDVAGRFIRRDNGDYVVVTYATAADAAAVAALQARVATLPGLVLTGLPLVNASLAARFPKELGLGLGFGAIVVVLLIWLEFRAIRPTLLAMLPTVGGLVWGLGALGWAGVVLDLFSVFAVLMFLGIGVDYGIHLLHPTLAPRGASMSESLSLVGPAMLLAGATTIVGFGTLVLSSYAPLRSLGLTSVATLAAALVAALVVLPAVVHGAEREA